MTKSEERQVISNFRNWYNQTHSDSHILKSAISGYLTLREKPVFQDDEETEAGKVSDGYHTFDELYEHRNTLFIALCKAKKETNIIWKTMPDNGWFIMGINIAAGKQITYHLPQTKWDETNFCQVLPPYNEYKFDGHSSNDVLDRLKGI